MGRWPYLKLSQLQSSPPSPARLQSYRTIFFSTSFTRSTFTASSETDSIYIISRTYNNTHQPSLVTWIHRGKVSSNTIPWLNSQGREEEGKHWRNKRGSNGEERRFGWLRMQGWNIPQFSFNKTNLWKYLFLTLFMGLKHACAKVFSIQTFQTVQYSTQHLKPADSKNKCQILKSPPMKSHWLLSLL